MPFDPSCPDPGRRRLLVVASLGAGLAACGGGDNGGDASDDGSDAAAPDANSGDAAATPDVQTSCTPDPVAIGPVANFAMGTWRLVSAARVPCVVGHDAQGLFAYSAVCPHAGCTVRSPSASGTTLCPCHGSIFDGNGGVTRGPARTPLEHYDVVVCDGTVTIDTGNIVDPSTRTPV